MTLWTTYYLDKDWMNVNMILKECFYYWIHIFFQRFCTLNHISNKTVFSESIRVYLRDITHISFLNWAMSRAYRLNKKLEILFTFDIKVKKIKVVNIFFLKVNIFKHSTISLSRCAHTPLQLWDLNYKKKKSSCKMSLLLLKFPKRKNEHGTRLC